MKREKEGTSPSPIPLAEIFRNRRKHKTNIMRLIFIAIIASSSLIAQNTIIYKNQKINELDLNYKKKGVWDLYGDKNIYIKTEMENDDFISSIQYFKDSKLIASQALDQTISIYKGSDTIQAKFKYRDDKSTTMVNSKGDEIDSETIIYFTQAAEVKPMFYGGSTELYSFINNNINYAKTKKNKGRVKVKFVINDDGLVEDAEVFESENIALNEEAVRIIKLLPRWQPGFQRGRFVKVKYTIPINFP